MKQFILVSLFWTSLAYCDTAHISVRVFDYAAIPQSVLVTAKNEASFVLGTGGISVTWIDCPKAMECSAPVTPSELIILIRPTRPDKLSGQIRGEVLGNAAGPSDGSGTYGWVWYDQVRRAATTAGFTTWHDLLGCVIAHEIGHLLLGPGHDAGTVMQASWGSHELELMAKRRLCFTASERIRMQKRVAARARSLTIDLASAAAK